MIMDRKYKRKFQKMEIDVPFSGTRALQRADGRTPKAERPWFSEVPPPSRRVLPLWRTARGRQVPRRRRGRRGRLPPQEPRAARDRARAQSGRDRSVRPGSWPGLVERWIEALSSTLNPL